MDTNVNTGSADYKSGYEAGFEAQTNGLPKTYPGKIPTAPASRYLGWHDGWIAAWEVENRELKVVVEDAAIINAAHNGIDIHGGTIEITISSDKRKLWINVDGICHLRTFNSNITVEQR